MIDLHSSPDDDCSVAVKTVGIKFSYSLLCQIPNQELDHWSKGYD